MHVCNDVSKLLLQIRDDKYYIYPGAPNQRIHIKFCPWCGVHLSTAVPNPAILTQFTDEQIHNEAFRRRYEFETDAVKAE